MRWDSPLVLATAGTLAVHLIVVTVTDAVVVTHPLQLRVPAPHIELVEVELPPVLKPAPPPPPSATPPPPAPVAPVTPVRPAPRAHAARAVPAPARAPEPPPPPTTAPATAASGGEQVVHMDDVAPSATGVGVAVGKPVTGRIGRGGSGGGTAAGSGSGAGELPRPVSVATIKHRALPRGDYAFFAAGKDYPAEARALGIEGALRVRLVVDEQGKVTSRVLLNHLGHGLDELALRRAAEIEFTPATDTDDRPVTSVVVWTFNMTLPK
jgi:TonB family protein